ncbi:MAG: DUF1800 family protein, partial [Proteobacteria bacterium]|nr:DUF1800 family protein [Pseudomonadota bacterium]
MTTQISAALASRRRLFGAILGSVADTSLDPRLSRRRAGRTGASDMATPLRPDALTTPPNAVRWLTRGTFGFTQADLATFNALGADDDSRWAAWLGQQLNPAAIADGACNSRIASAGFTTLGKSPAQLWADHHADTANYFNRMLPVSEAECATLIRQTYSQRQLFEVAT